MKKGFSLIEVILYIGLLSVLITTAFVSAFQLIDSSSRVSMKNLIIGEKIFIMKKFDLAFNNLSISTYPAIEVTAPCAETITIYKKSPGENTAIRRNADTNSIEVKDGPSSIFTPINTDRAKVTCLDFEILRSTDDTPEKILVKIKIDDEDLEIIKFIKHE